MAVTSRGVLGVKVRESLGLLRLRIGTSTPAGSKDVINVNLADIVVEAHVEVGAFIRDIGHVGHVPIAVSLSELFVLLLTHERVPVGHVDEGGSGVILPIGNTVSDSETLEVRLKGIFVISVLLVVLDDVVGKVGHIDSSIRLTRDVKLVLLELREEFVPLKDGGEVVLATGVIIEGAVLGALTVRVTDTCGLLNVEDVGLSVPRVSILVECGATGGKLEGTVLLHETEHGGAAGATIEPDEDWSGLRVLLSLEEEIVDFLGGVGDVEVARESTILVEGAHLGEGGHTVVLGLGGGDSSKGCDSGNKLHKSNFFLIYDY